MLLKNQNPKTIVLVVNNHGRIRHGAGDHLKVAPCQMFSRSYSFAVPPAILGEIAMIVVLSNMEAI
eukprot:918966-Pyramimonas_sp.AAC.1